MGARNEAEVIAMLGPALLSAVQYVADKIYEDNQELVMDEVYSKGGGSYDRTYDLLTAWKAESEGGGSHSTGKFEFDPGAMDSHPSLIGQGDPGPNLIEIVYHGLAGDFGWGVNNGRGKRYASTNPLFAGEAWAAPRDAWKALVKRVGKRKIRQYFQAGMSQAGLKWRSRGGSIGMLTTDASGNSVMK